MVHTPRSVGHLGPFWPNFNEAKRSQGGSPSASKAQVGPPEPVFEHGPQSTNFGQEPKAPNFQPRTTCGPLSAMASGNPQWPPAQLKSTLPLKSKGRFFHSSRIQEWTQVHDSTSRSQNPSPISKEDSSAHQSGTPWPLSEDHSRIPTTFPCRSWAGNSFRISSRAILRGYTSFKQFSRQKVLQYSLDNSIGPYRQQ
ncbi:hypothetical protein O181_012177 [Austropuccinia psidii MF-1]|uniref:Uncharacterized protein n=1 Tax=Austropuccinia psidii MF-1 TaxID=1389203 RepID=A0A9Q3BVZ4_9BASI|nr:hypothetical protein [Austropuccinia psidii MF-1]